MAASWNNHSIDADVDGFKDKMPDRASLKLKSEAAAGGLAFRFTGWNPTP
jgi:hypothetical protein